MLRFIITLALIGALIGLIFSRRGRESEDTLRGAKKGAKLGCFLGCLYVLLLGLVIAAGGFLFLL